MVGGVHQLDLLDSLHGLEVLVLPNIVLSSLFGELHR